MNSLQVKDVWVKHYATTSKIDSLKLKFYLHEDEISFNLASILKTIHQNLPLHGHHNNLIDIKRANHGSVEF